MLVRGGVTKSFGPPEPIAGLGFLPGSLRPRRRRARAAAGLARGCATGALPGGWAADDGVGLLFAGTGSTRVVSARPGTGAAGRRGRGELVRCRASLFGATAGEQAASSRSTAPMAASGAGSATTGRPRASLSVDAISGALSPVRTTSASSVEAIPAVSRAEPSVTTASSSAAPTSSSKRPRSRPTRARTPGSSTSTSAKPLVDKRLLACVQRRRSSAMAIRTCTSAGSSRAQVAPSADRTCAKTRSSHTGPASCGTMTGGPSRVVIWRSVTFTTDTARSVPTSMIATGPRRPPFAATAASGAGTGITPRSPRRLRAARRRATAPLVQPAGWASAMRIGDRPRLPAPRRRRPRTAPRRRRQ